MRIVFFGSDDFALEHLRYLVENKYKVMACVTQPDRPRGRGWKMIISPIKEYALRHDIPVWQPDDMRDASFTRQLREADVELFVVIAFGRFLPDEILALPAWGSINVHASLLPKYRGAGPINWAIIKGETRSGITIMKLNATMDGGDMIAQIPIEIDPRDDAPHLRAKMIAAGPAFLGETIIKIKRGENQLIPQDASQVTFAPKLKKAMGLIDWSRSAKDIHNLVRGLKPWPSTYTHWKSKTLKILETELVETHYDAAPGTIVAAGKQGILTATVDNALLIKQVHLENARPMDALAFIVGHKVDVGYAWDR
ncbi:MAG: methionyl-tRNA formyltransferase [Candidatus Omnitrophica bacterium]|nr:methionyl-tRNA formyltransferase [Candidatus Omnitrophota bacterium]